MRCIVAAATLASQSNRYDGLPILAVGTAPRAPLPTLVWGPNCQEGIYLRHSGELRDHRCVDGVVSLFDREPFLRPDLAVSTSRRAQPPSRLAVAVTARQGPRAAR